MADIKKIDGRYIKDASALLSVTINTDASTYTTVTRGGTTTTSSLPITHGKTDITSSNRKIVASDDLYNYLADTYLNSGVQYLGTVNSSANLIKSNPSVGKGDFYRVSGTFSISGETAHVGDIVIAINDKPTTNTSTNWDILHTETGGADTWRAIKVNGTQLLNTTPNSSALNIVSNTNINLSTNSNGDVTIDALGYYYDDINAGGAGGFSIAGGVGIGTFSFAHGSNSTANGEYSHAEGNETLASGDYTHAEGYQTQANKAYSHVEGEYNIINNEGVAAHAEGYQNTVGAPHAHAEGYHNYIDNLDIQTEQGFYSHAEGEGNQIYAKGAHAEGAYNIIKSEANYAHVGGYKNIATNEYQCVIGKFNDDGATDSTDILFTVGNGSDESARSNALELYEHDGGWLRVGHVEAMDVDARSGNWVFYTNGGVGPLPAPGDVNQKAFSFVKIGNSSIAAATTTDTFEISSGTNITLTTNSANKRITISTSAEANQNAYSKIKVGTVSLDASAKMSTLEVSAGSHITLTTTNTAASKKIVIASDGEANQKAFSFVKIGNSSCAATTTTDTLELVAGANITLTPSGKTITIASSGGGGNYLPITGGVMQGAIDMDNSDLRGVNNIYGGKYDMLLSTEQLIQFQACKGEILELDGTGTGIAAGGYPSLYPKNRATLSLGNPQRYFNELYVVEGYAQNGFYQISDERKKNIHGELDLNKAYDLIEKCSTILYDLKSDESHKEQIGVIAQEIEEFFPEIVNTDKDGFKSVDYAKLTVVIMKVLKDLITRVSNIENKIK